MSKQSFIYANIVATLLSIVLPRAFYEDSAFAAEGAWVLISAFLEGRAGSRPDHQVSIAVCLFAVDALY